MTIRTQTKSPGTVVSDDNIGDIAWVDPEKAEVEDNDPATATGPGISEWLKCTGYDFTPPSTASLLTLTPLVRRRTATVGAATIEYVGGEVADVTSGTSVTVDVPDGTLPGHVMIAQVLLLADESVDTPAGWTLIGTDINSAESRARVASYYRVAGEDEPASYTWTWGDLVSHAAAIDTWSGVDNASVLASNVSTSDSGASTGTSHAASTVTTTADDAMLIAHFGFSPNGGTVTAPSGMTLRAASPLGGYLRGYSEVIEDAGATGSRTATTTSSVGSARIMFALKPAPTYAEDSGVRLVVDDAIDTEEYSTGAVWADAYQEDELGPIDVSAVAVADVDADFGWALVTDLPDGVQADVDHAPATLTWDTWLDVAITEPPGDLTSPGGPIEWSAEYDGNPITQASYRVRIYARPSLTLLYDSGVVASADLFHVIGSGTPATPWSSPQNGQAIRIVVDVVEDGTADTDSIGDPIAGSASVDTVTAWAPLPAITGLTATAVTEEA